MSVSKVPDGALTPDEGHGVEARGSAGVGVVSLGSTPHSMGAVGWRHGAAQGLLMLEPQRGTPGRKERGQVAPSCSTCLSHAPLAPQGRPALLVAAEPSEGVPYPLPTT